MTEGIGYKEKADTLFKMWKDKDLTEDEYNTLMNRLINKALTELPSEDFKAVNEMVTRILSDNEE